MRVGGLAPALVLADAQTPEQLAAQVSEAEAALRALLRQVHGEVGDIRARGVEVEGDWRVTGNLILSANGSYNDAHYTAYPNAPCPAGVAAPCNLTGRPVYQAPRWVGNLTARYDTELNNGAKPFALVQYTYRSGVFGSVDDAAYSRIEGYSLVNARIGARFGGHYEASIWVNNLFDKVYLQTLGAASIPGAGAFGTTGQLGTPQTWGVTLRAEY